MVSRERDKPTERNVTQTQRNPFLSPGRKKCERSVTVFNSSVENHVEKTIPISKNISEQGL